jgi:lycopene beta-cyclase
MHGEYVLLLLLSLASVVLLDQIAGLGVFRQWRRLTIALVPTWLIILAWDLLGVIRWHWTSNQAVLLGPYGFGGRIPLEEFLFPLVIGAVALTLWELLGRHRAAGRRAPREDGRS